MKIQLIRNATLKMTMSGHTFIIDPYLAPKYGMPSYTGASPNPLVDLPIPVEAVLGGCEMAVISHMHSDHFDPTAQELLSKSIPIFSQPADAEKLRNMGFTDTNPIHKNVKWFDVQITRTPAQHGTGQVLEDMGPASGFVFSAKDTPVVYWLGDTIWTDEINATIQQVHPDVIITHSGGAVWGNRVPIIMDDAQTAAVCFAAPDSLVIAVHMEALDHCTVTRAGLRDYTKSAGIPASQLIIPADGEIIQL